MNAPADYPATWFGFGNNYISDASASWILKNPFTKEFNIFYMNKWHHLCLAYEKNTNKISMIKVRQEKVYKDLTNTNSFFYKKMGQNCVDTKSTTQFGQSK